MTANLLYSAAWRKMKKLLDDDRQDLVTQLINQRSHDESMELRGRIKQIDQILERFPQVLGTDDNDED